MATHSAVPLPNACRLLNHGPTALVSGVHQGRCGAMATSCSMPLDFDPPRVVGVIDKSTLTREPVATSGKAVEAGE